ncbi:methyltransferase [Paenibacillus sp. J31TS4]|uniref:MgtC/SapB family protein n=1 Tax=Paenibacillus sp. J31TS4 TaxID=2807195 RepID=UPI001AFD3987|nr:MgtC/SapB family protein [Paenibacillus sp. J31TS4]GIP40355.1 methyltransferase [Paenibacillus sp. J31TS4]
MPITGEIHPEVWQISHLDLTLRIILALVLGGLIGIEREWSNHAAGFRTHILVCVGSAAIMLLSIYGFGEFAMEPNVRMDPARLAAQVISGIGFLGAGAILRTGPTVSGLTTAASIWVVAAIGLSVGAGFYYGAILVTGLVLVSLFFLNKWEKHLLRHRRNHDLIVKVLDRPGTLTAVTASLSKRGIQIKNVHLEHETDTEMADGEDAVMSIRLVLKTPKPEDLIHAIEEVGQHPNVVSLDSGSLPAAEMKLPKFLSRDLDA